MEDRPLNFPALVQAARAGDQEALAELIRLYEPQLRVLARSRLGPALHPYLDSVDLVQSVHRSLMLGLRANKFDISAPNNLIALAMTIVQRKIARHWRHLQRQRRLETGSSNELLPSLSMLHCRQEDPAKAAEFNDQLRRVYNAFDPSERRVLELRLEGHTIAETARMLGMDPHLLRVRLGRLRQMLRETGVLTEWL